MTRARRLYERSVRQGLLQFPWHPGWLDSRREARIVLTALREPAGLVVAEEATIGSDWVARRAGPGWRFLTPAMLAAGEMSGGPFPVCLLYSNSLELSSLPDMLRRIRPHLAPGARTHLVFGGEWQCDPQAAIAQAVAGSRIDRIDVVRSAAQSRIGRAWSRILMRASMTASPARWAGAAVRLAMLAVAALASNLIRLIVPGFPGPPTSVLVTLGDAVAPAAADGRHARA